MCMRSKSLRVSLISLDALLSLLIHTMMYTCDGMFVLKVMRKTRYDEVTAQQWTGPTDEFHKRRIYCQLHILLRNLSIDPVQQWAVTSS